MTTNEETPSGITRRSLALGVGGAAALLGLGGAVKLADAGPICRPPGGQDADSFIGRCVRCDKCREACPQQVIVPAKLETGFINTRTPTLNFKLGWCDFCEEANGGHPLCVETCPTAALTLLPEAQAKDVVIGLAWIMREWCLGWQLRGCRRCVDECPYEALELDSANRPVLIEDKCNGCGKCENVCPSLMAASYTVGATDRAITIRPVETVRKLALDSERRG